MALSIAPVRYEMLGKAGKVFGNFILENVSLRGGVADAASIWIASLRSQ